MTQTNESIRSVQAPIISENAPAFYSGKMKITGHSLSENEHRYHAIYSKWESRHKCSRPPRVTYSQPPVKMRHAVKKYPESHITTTCNYRHDPYNMKASKVYLKRTTEDSLVAKNLCEYPYW